MTDINGKDLNLNNNNEMSVCIIFVVSLFYKIKSLNLIFPGMLVMNLTNLRNSLVLSNTETRHS